MWIEITATDPNLVNAPPGWAVCNAALKKFTPPSAMGFVCAPGDLNRFWSRYRVAKSFREIVLDSYTAETTAGYSALFRVFLTWSAFEHFLTICGLNLPGMVPLLPPYDPTAAETRIRAIEGHADFLRFVLQRLDRANHRAQVQAFPDGQPCNLLYLPAGIRHIFAHGKLTPNSGTGTTEPVRQIVEVLSELLFRIMDGEFTRRLRDHGFAF